MRAIIIDDESKGRIALRNSLEKYCPSIEIVGEGSSVESGLESVRTAKPELVFLDIEMPDGTGFDLLEKIKKADFQVIFVTAHDHYAVKAFRYSALDYLTKPVDPDQLIEAVDRAEKESDSGHIEKKLEALIANRNSIEKIAVPTSDGMRLLKIKQIMRCQSDSNYTNIFTTDQEKVVVTRTLKEFTDILSEHGFHRIHHSHLVNISYVDRFVNRDGGYVIMEDGTQVELSRRKKEEFLAALTSK